MISSDIKDKLWERLDKLTPQSKALWGKMSVEQMLAHMNDAFKISLGMKASVDRSNYFTRMVTFPVGVYLLPRWPRGEATAPELDPAQQGTEPRDFYTEQEFLKKMMDVFNEREEEKLKPHPMFGKLTKAQWAALFVKHLNHHLRQFGV